MMLSGTLNTHLEEVDRNANEMMDTMTRRRAKEQDITETLKAHDQMEWVRRMNNIRAATEEVVLREVVYA